MSDLDRELASPRSALDPGGLVDRLNRLRLADGDFTKFNVCFSFRAWGDLTNILGIATHRADDAHPIKIVTCHPNLSLTEFTQPKPLDTGEQSHLFFDIRVKSANQEKRLARLLELAFERGANIIVFPELAVDYQRGEDAPPMPAIEALGAQFIKTAHREKGKTRLLVAGSRHRGTTPDDRRNESFTYMGYGTRPFIHNKFQPFLVDNPSYIAGRQGSEGSAQLKEAIRIPSRPTIVVHSSPGFSVVTLICADFLRNDVPPLLAKLGVNLLLVPAMTPKTLDFDQLATGLANQNQAWIVLANNPGEWKGGHRAARVVLRRPDDAGSATFEGQTTPGIYVWELGGGDPEWVNLPDL